VYCIASSRSFLCATSLPFSIDLFSFLVGMIDGSRQVSLYTRDTSQARTRELFFSFLAQHWSRRALLQHCSSPVLLLILHDIYTLLDSRSLFMKCIKQSVQFESNRIFRRNERKNVTFRLWFFFLLRSWSTAHPYYILARAVCVSSLQQPHSSGEDDEGPSATVPPASIREIASVFYPTVRRQQIISLPALRVA